MTNNNPILPVDDIPQSILVERNHIETRCEPGEFWKPCPGTTKGYYCCGYQIITPLTGCGMYCRYCVLQAYLETPAQIAYQNLDDMEKEIAQKMSQWNGVVRFGTGEFADSLYLEDKLNLSEKIAALLDPYPNAVIEFKTKSTNIETLFHIKNPDKVVIGFSLNTPAMISLHERNTAALDNRLKAAAECIDKGFWVAFHFDPILFYPQWKQDYMEVVDKVFSYVKKPSRIAWWSMGGFRSPLALKEHLKKNALHLPLFAQEMILGEDGKYRYLKPQRIEFYIALHEYIDKQYSGIPLYLCMESPEVWDASGLLPRIPNGLTQYLDTRAEKMLGLK